MFNIDIEADGMKQVDALLESLRFLGSGIGGVELHARDREDSESTNDEILEFLAKSGRDFVTPSDKDVDEIAQQFIDYVLPRLEQESKLGEKANRKQWSEVASKGLIQSAKEWMEQIVKRIETQSTNVPPFNSELSESYAKKKLKDFGFIKPIGKASGHVLDNVNPDGVGARNIRLKKN